MAKPPSQEEINKVLVYKDGDLIWRERGNGKFDKQFAGKKAGSLHSKGYWVVRFNQFGAVMAHLIVWTMHNGEIPKGMDIDHIDGDKLNNKIDNLRLATRSQNFCNIGLRSNNKSGHKNVFWSKQSKKWRVDINFNKKIIIRRDFDDLEIACLVASEFRDKFHGQFANSGHKEKGLD